MDTAWLGKGVLLDLGEHTGQHRYAPAGLGGSPRMNCVGVSESCHIWPHRLCPNFREHHSCAFQ